MMKELREIQKEKEGRTDLIDSEKEREKVETEGDGSTMSRTSKLQ